MNFSFSDSKNWTFFFLNTTQWIDPIFLNATQKLKFSVEKVKNEFFSIFWKLKIDSFHMTRRIEPAFSTWLRELNYFWNWLKVFFNGLEESNPFFQYDSTNRTFLKCDSFFKMIQRTEPLFGGITQRIGLDSKTWTLCFSNLIPRIGLILMTPRLEASFLNYVTKNFFWKKMTQRIGPKFLTQRYVFLYDSKNWFFCMTQRIETFFFEYDTENWTLFLFCRKELKLFPLCRKWLSFFFSKILLTQRIELFFLWYDSKKWNPKKKKNSKSWTFF